MTQHTPTPWRVWDGERRVILNAESSSLGETTSGDPFISIETEIANAAFIVRAVNAHDDLVAALEFAIGVIDKAGIIWMGDTNARAALAKARGETS